MGLGRIRWAHLGYVGLLGLLGSFALGMFGVVMLEAHGPGERMAGDVVDRVEGEREQCGRAYTPGRGFQGPERCTTYPTFTVLGVRADDSPWIVVGESAFDAVTKGEAVEVTTSPITGRVVGLAGANGAWTLRSSGFYAFAIGLLVLVVVLGAGYEFVRIRKGRFVDGPMRRRDLWALLPSTIAGLAIAWLILFWPSVGLEVVR